MRDMGLGQFEATITAPTFPCLMWYDFRAQDPRGRWLYYGNARDGLGGVGTIYQDHPAGYQITVYDPAYQTPDYLRQGIMYQIFPDRFHRQGELHSQRDDITLHQDWQDTPQVVPDPRSGDNCALDFYGGNLQGIIAKLPYLKDLGVTVLYLNPIFKARSNHRYDTGDYLTIDPLLGTLEDFQQLCRQAHDMGMRILLDGVFSHTGEDSLYFNRYGRYGAQGAFQSTDSPYCRWYTFKQYPDQYACWWNIPTLPQVDKESPSYQEFILGPQGVVRYWLAQGADGWRLDVADELPMPFIAKLRQAAHAQRADSAVLGEVWEDASRKVAYGKLRSYCLGDTLDSVMNYPLRDAVIRFLTGQGDAQELARLLHSLQENYPVPFFYSLMNLLGSHDRARILNLLCQRDWCDLPWAQRGDRRLPPDLRRLAISRLEKMLAIYMALPGIPSIYYGDEAGMEGAADPFCRGPFPWGREDQEVAELFRQAIRLRRARPVLRTGTLRVSSDGPDTLCIQRELPNGLDAFGQPVEDAPYTLCVTRDGIRL